MTFEINTQLFTGTLTELWKKSKEGEIDLVRFPLYPVFSAYRENLENLENMNLDKETKNLSLLSSLLTLKLSLLLPLSLPQIEEVIEEEEEERTQEVWEEILTLAEILKEKENEELEYFFAGFWEEAEEEWEIEVNPNELVEAFSRLMETLSRQEVMEIREEEFTVKEKIELILKLMEEKPRIKFSSLFLKARNRVEMVVIFIALLELIRRNLIKVYQRIPFGEIWIRRNIQ